MSIEDYWKYRADISWVVAHKKMSNQKKADKIWHFLNKIPPFRDPEHRTVLMDLVAAAKGSEEEFEEKLEVLYNFCDYARIWVSG